MAIEPLLIEFADPIPATIRLPALGGAIEAVVTAVDVRPSGDMWVKATIPIWQRWRTQAKVGEYAIEGIGPATTDLWAPSAAVAIDTDRGPEVAAMVRRAKANA